MPLVLTKFGFTHEINSFQREAPDGTMRTFWMSQGTGGRFNTINYTFSYKASEGEDVTSPLYLRAHLIIFQDKYWESIGHGRSVMNGTKISRVVKVADGTQKEDDLRKLEIDAVAAMTEVGNAKPKAAKKRASSGSTKSGPGSKTSIRTKTEEDKNNHDLIQNDNAIIDAPVSESSGKPLWQQLDKVSLKSSASYDGDLIGRNKLITICNTPTSKLRMYLKDGTQNEFVGSVSLRIEATSSKYFSCDLGVRFGLDREVSDGEMEPVPNSECLTPRMCIITKIKLDKNARTATKLREVWFPLREHGAFQSPSRLREVSAIARKIVNRSKKLIAAAKKGTVLPVKGRSSNETKPTSSTDDKATGDSKHAHYSENKKVKTSPKHTGVKRPRMDSHIVANKKSKQGASNAAKVRTENGTESTQNAEASIPSTTISNSNTTGVAMHSGLPLVLAAAGTSASTNGSLVQSPTFSMNAGSQNDVSGFNGALARAGTLFPTACQSGLSLPYLNNMNLVKSGDVNSSNALQLAQSQESVPADSEAFALFRMQSLVRDRTLLQKGYQQYQQEMSEHAKAVANKQLGRSGVAVNSSSVADRNSTNSSMAFHGLQPMSRSGTMQSLGLESLASAAAEADSQAAKATLAGNNPLISSASFASTASGSLFSLSQSSQEVEYPLENVDSLKFLSGVAEMEGIANAKNANQSS